MKLLNVVTIAAALIASTSASPAVRRLTQDEEHQFLQSKDTLKQQVIAWKQSDAGKYAQAHGLVNSQMHPSGVGDNVTDDELQRFFLTKLGIEKAQQANPEAFFSTDSPFSLMTDEEFAKFVGDAYSNMAILAEVQVITNNASAASTHEDLLAASKDWTTSGCVAPVKQQGQCGSCWAFAAAGALESAYCLKGHPLQQFSEQQLNSCDTQSHGCQGGFPSFAFSYVQQVGGICTEESYPYVSGQSQTTEECIAQQCQNVPVKIHAIKRAQVSERGFLAALNQQPMTVVIAAGNNVWKQYRGGVVTSCSSSQLDHAVLAVGYGTSTSSFYKIKNSWGSTWGDRGFIYLARSGSTCGIMNDNAVYPALS